jgi:hypothetical protein
MKVQYCRGHGWLAKSSRIGGSKNYGVPSFSLLGSTVRNLAAPPPPGLPLISARQIGLWHAKPLFSTSKRLTGLSGYRTQMYTNEQIIPVRRCSESFC